MDIAEIYLTSEFASYYCIEDSLLIGDLRVACYYILVSGLTVYEWSDLSIRLCLKKHASASWCCFSFQNTGGYLLVYPFLEFSQ